MSGPLTLLYLPVRARAEALRMLLRHVNIQFVDRVVPFEEWTSLKSTMPAGRSGAQQLPVLQLPDGTLMPESADIAKYIATLAGPLTLSEDVDAAYRMWTLPDEFDAPGVSEAWPRHSLVNPCLNWFPQEEAELKLQALPMAAVAFLRSLLPMFTGSGGAFFGGVAPHYGEFNLFHYMDNLVTLDGGASLAALGKDGEPLKKWFEAMQSLPGVASYLAERPQAGNGSVGRPGSIIFKHAVPDQREA